ncbi:MAG: sialate O-acetylesterase [Bacillota bacterium]
MHWSRRWVIAVSGLCTAAGLWVGSAQADVTMPRVFGNDMVIQRDMPIPVWGWADAGEKVTVRLDDAEVATTATDKGEWMVKLPAQSAGGPHKMTIAGKNTIELTNILAGEVWVCSGQSNMEMGVRMCKDANQEIAAADYPQIRLFMVDKKTSGYPLNDVNGGWRVCSPTTIAANGWGGFSAAAYYFGREIHKTLNVPVGLIDTSWGGTRIEPWTPPEGFAAVPALKGIVETIEKVNSDYPKVYAKALDQLEAAIPAARKALADGKPLPALPAMPRHPLDHEQQPTGLYNAMVKGVVPFAIRGAIWYQGESNLGEGMMYYEKMKGLIAGWRKVWSQSDMPFYFVQLAPYRYGGDPTKLPGIWEAQTAVLAVPNTGMAVTTDVATVNDIHPPDKQTVGKRLALWALAKTYGKSELVYSGPLYKSMRIEGNKVRISFNHVGSGLASHDGKELSWFEIAGTDKNYVKAKAAIDGDTVMVWAEGVSQPTAVRFGWHELAEPNLMNKEGLPASPFRAEK